jgi:hypothetical protein
VNTEQPGGHDACPAFFWPFTDVRNKVTRAIKLVFAFIACLAIITHHPQCFGSMFWLDVLD